MTERPGYDALWLWFGLSRASWLTLPRALMHEMPDDWQRRMAELLGEWDDAWNCDIPIGRTRVMAVADNGRLTKFPAWVTDYRRPDVEAINAVREP